MKIVLTVNYRTPSLNVTMRQHWAAQYREKKKAWKALADALESASLDTELKCLIQTISQLQPRRSSMVCGIAASSKGMNRGASYSKPIKSALRASKKNEQS